ncbi:MAG: hypothetical protein ACRDRY_17830 [Pseudonocardiaceae bacterium]
MSVTEEPTCYTGLNDPVRVDVFYEYRDTDNEHVALVATFDDGRPPVELTFDPIRAGNIASLLMKACDAWEAHNYEQGEAMGLLAGIEPHRHGDGPSAEETTP